MPVFAQLSQAKRRARRRRAGRSTASAMERCWAKAAARVVVEELEHAQRRGARILAEVVGFGAGTGRGPERRGIGADRCGWHWPAPALVLPTSITSTPMASARAMATPGKPAGCAAAWARRLEPFHVLAVKSYMGNLGSGSGLVELTASLLALRQGHRARRRCNYQEYDPDCPVFCAARTAGR